MKKILLVDAFGIIFRSYYAFITRPLKNKNGENVSALFGFFRGIFSILRKENPDYLLIALEGKGPCFRNKIYPEYKANRQETPEDLKEQIVKIIDLIEKLGFPHFYQDGFEADDIIGTLTEWYTEKEDCEVLIFSSDKDLRQLVKERVSLCRPDPKSNQNLFYAREEIFQEMGIYPEQVADYLALTGDKSDNIPGVPGIGDKSAVGLLSTWQSLENIYENIDKITPAGLQKKLELNREKAYLSKQLTVIQKNIPLDIKEDEIRKKPFHLENAITLLEKDGLKSIIQEIKDYNKNNFSLEEEDFSYLKKESYISTEEETPKEQSIIEQVSMDFHVIKTEEELFALIEQIEKEKKFSFDLETTGFRFFSDNIICLSITIPSPKLECPHETFVIPFYLSEEQTQIVGKHLTASQCFLLLKPVFEDEGILKIGQNLKFDNKFLRQFSIEKVSPIFDTMIAEYCLDGTNNILGLKDLGEKYLHCSMIRYEDIVDDTKKKTLLDVDFPSLVIYSGQDAYITYRLYEILSEKILKDSQLITLFYNIEMPLVGILTNMETNGVFLDSDHLLNLANWLEEKMDVLTDSMYTMAEQEFNPNSPIQLREILFGRFGLPILKKTKTGASTDVDVLKKLSYLHPFPGLLLEYRTYSKIKSTYTQNLVSMIEPKTNRIHTTYLQTGTQTGRLSSKDPNLQNIPVRNEIGREIRKAFLPSKGNKMVSADYSQIEIFLLAEFSNDPILTDAIRNNEDIHIKTASILFEKSPEQVTKQERGIAKTVNFGILYGQSAFTLAEDLNISRQQANQFIEKYFENYEGVKKYISFLKEQCKENGYSITKWGRKRTIKEIYEKNKNIRENGERMAVNSVIQGSAADLIKQAMIKICSQIEKQNLQATLILQVHDELIFDVPEQELDVMIKLIKKEMETGFPFQLPLRTSIEIGKTWGEMH